MKRLLIPFFLLPIVIQSTAQSQSEQRPNIVVILCDDLGYGDLASYGHPYIRTPNLDNMAKEGIRFTNFYSAAPVCSPSRVGLLTGRSPNRAGVYDWIPPANEPKPDGREQVHMRREETTIPQLLKKAGYATAMAGKWHCNSMFNSSLQPQPGDAGFDHWLSTQNNAFPTHENPNNFVRNGEAVGMMEGYSCQIVADEGITWLKNHSEKNPKQPFFMYLPSQAPHRPCVPPPFVQGKSDAGNRGDMVFEFDWTVGRIMDTLEKLGLVKNTLLIVTSDNGMATAANRDVLSWHVMVTVLP